MVEFGSLASVGPRAPRKKLAQAVFWPVMGRPSVFRILPGLDNLTYDSHVKSEGFIFYNIYITEITRKVLEWR